MNITEANDVNRVLSWVLGVRTDWDHDDEVLFHEAGLAAARLAERAHKALSAGLTGDQVRAAWPRVEAGPWLDVKQPTVEDVDTGGLT